MARMCRLFQVPGCFGSSFDKRVSRCAPSGRPPIRIRGGSVVSITGRRTVVQAIREYLQDRPVYRRFCPFRPNPFILRTVNDHIAIASRPLPTHPY